VIDADDFAAARRANGTIRQIAHASYDAAARALTAWVAPVVVARQSLFARAVGPQNAAIVTGLHSGEVGIFGAGAGGDATAVAILSDIAAIARDRAAIVPPPSLTSDFLLRTTSDFRLPTSDFSLAEAV
jgi:homoserine dehydrogenase